MFASETECIHLFVDSCNHSLIHINRLDINSFSEILYFFSTNIFKDVNDKCYFQASPPTLCRILNKTNLFVSPIKFYTILRNEVIN
jgi:hypothetical protein